MHHTLADSLFQRQILTANTAVKLLILMQQPQNTPTPCLCSHQFLQCPHMRQIQIYLKVHNAAGCIKQSWVISLMLCPVTGPEPLSPCSVSKNIQMDIHITIMVLDFKLQPCSEWRILCSGWFPSIWILCADISEHPVFSIFIGSVSRKNNRDNIAEVFIQIKVCLSLSQTWTWLQMITFRHCDTTVHAVAQLVEAPRYKPEGRGFDSR